MMKSLLEASTDFLQVGIMFDCPLDERREPIVVQTLPEEETRSLGELVPVSQEIVSYRLPERGLVGQNDARTPACHLDHFLPPVHSPHHQSFTRLSTFSPESFSSIRKQAREAETK